MEIRSEESVNFSSHCTIHPKMLITTICRSPFCGYYRELCNECLLTEHDHKQKFHLPINLAVSHVENRLKDIQKSIIILKKLKEQKSKTNPITLPFEVKEKLSHIREIINQKISLFQKSLEQMYERQVNMKLQSLSQTLRKSLDFLKKEINQFEKRYDIQPNLKKYFLNFDYWEHERKYYKSYMEQILQKQVQKFKQGFDDDNIMKLIVNFEINLKSIFSQIKENQKKENILRPHLFTEERNILKKYQMVERLSHQHFVIKPQFLGKPYPKENIKWCGSPQSIYYPDFDCFYIFGQGKTPSNAILKYEDGNLNGNRKLSLIGQMFTKRAYFSICLINGQIFIVGGYNQKEGCIAKCEKMVLNTKTKIYSVSSLQQRSACHSVCNYKNKFILKFGGTSIKLNQKQSYHIESQVKQLYPEIYEVQKEQWRVIRYNTHNSNERLEFGLWPLIVIPYETDQNKIIVFGNRPLQKYQSSNNKINQTKRKKFQIKCHFNRNDVEMKISQGFYELNKRYIMYPETCYSVEKKGLWKVFGIDQTKNQNTLHLLDIKHEN